MLSWLGVTHESPGPQPGVLFPGSVHLAEDGGAGPVSLRWLDYKPAGLVAASRGPLQGCLEVLSSGLMPPTTSSTGKELTSPWLSVAEQYTFVIGVDTYAAVH